jgi:1,2-diacylglycerol 3-beta-galactosyltransferase
VPTPKRILILSVDTGFGHRSAAKAIAAAIQELFGEQCATEIVNPMDDERVPSLLRNSGDDYDRVVREMRGLYKLNYAIGNTPAPSAIVDGIMTVVLYEAMRDLLKRHQPDVVITTYLLYQASLDAVYTLSGEHIPLLTVVTDMAPVHRLWFHAVADLCLVASPGVRDQALEHGLPAAKVRVTGIPVHPDLVREKRSAPAIREELRWLPNVKTALAVGSKRVGNLSGVLHALNHSGLPLQLAVVAGGDEESYQQFLETEWHLPTHVYDFVDNMPTLMHAADCLICKAGGLIVTEALACGLPMLLVDALPGQEVGNANFVIQGGAGDFKPEPIDALELVSHWLARDGELLAQRAQNARNLGRPRSAYEVAELAWALADQGVRPAYDAAHRRWVTDLLNHLNMPGSLMNFLASDQPEEQG